MDGTEVKGIDKKFTGSNMIMNIFLVLLVLFFLTLAIVCIVITHSCIIKQYCCSCGKSFCQYLMNKLMYNSVIRGMLEAYFLLSISAVYELSKAYFNDGIDDSLNFTVAAFTFIYLLALPICSMIFLWRNFEILETKNMVSKYGTLY